MIAPGSGATTFLEAAVAAAHSLRRRTRRASRRLPRLELAALCLCLSIAHRVLGVCWGVIAGTARQEKRWR